MRMPSYFIYARGKKNLTSVSSVSSLRRSILFPVHRVGGLNHVAHAHNKRSATLRTRRRFVVLTVARCAIQCACRRATRNHTRCTCSSADHLIRDPAENNGVFFFVENVLVGPHVPGGRRGLTCKNNKKNTNTNNNYCTIEGGEVRFRELRERVGRWGEGDGERINAECRFPGGIPRARPRKLSRWPGNKSQINLTVRVQSYVDGSGTGAREESGGQ